MLWAQAKAQGRVPGSSWLVYKLMGNVSLKEGIHPLLQLELCRALLLTGPACRSWRPTIGAAAWKGLLLKALISVFLTLLCGREINTPPAGMSITKQVSLAHSFPYIPHGPLLHLTSTKRAAPSSNSTCPKSLSARLWRKRSENHWCGQTANRGRVQGMQDKKEYQIN